MPVENLREPKLIHPGNSACSLGAITLAGFIPDSQWQREAKPRKLGRYGLVYSLAGACDYEDAVNGRRRLNAGDLAVLFPDIRHRYGGKAGGWDEFFIVFEGPVFDLWRRCGLLHPRRAFFSLHPVAYWRGRLEACVADLPAADSPLQAVVRLQHLLAEVLEGRGRQEGGRPRGPWLAAARRALDQAGNGTLACAAAARRLGLAPETFRKKFQKAAGLSPSRYCRSRRIAAAGRLLRESDHSCSEIAEALGFSDVYHFSKAFKAATGLSPVAYRKRLLPG